MGFFIFLLFLAGVAWIGFTQIAARQQTSISSPYDVATARRLVSNSFGMTWNAVPGRGDSNFKPKLRVRAPVLSVSYSAAGSGGCNVDIWCSAFVTRYGLIHHAQLMWRKKRAVAMALTRSPQSLQSPQSVPSVPSVPSAPPAQFGSPQPSAAGAAGVMTQHNLQGTDRILAEAPQTNAVGQQIGQQIGQHNGQHDGQHDGQHNGQHDGLGSDDAAWLSSGEGRYSSLISNHYGSPDTIAAGGDARIQGDDPAAALFFYQKAIDTLHSIYVCGFNDTGPASWSRQPSSRDYSILNRYLTALRAIRQIRPGAPVGSSVTEVTHRMRTISSQFKRHGLDPVPYLDSLGDLARIAPDVDVSKVLWQ